MLSGGERALTAVALLFAMLEVRPGAVLRARRGRRRARRGERRPVRRRAAEPRRTRPSSSSSPTTAGTIEAADALYGVTVGDDSVSRVISLRLDEAQALATHAIRTASWRSAEAAEPCPSGDAAATRSRKPSRPIAESIPSRSTRTGSPIRPTSRTQRADGRAPSTRAAFDGGTGRTPSTTSAVLAARAGPEPRPVAGWAEPVRRGPAWRPVARAAAAEVDADHERARRRPRSGRAAGSWPGCAASSGRRPEGPTGTRSRRR